MAQYNALEPPDLGRYLRWGPLRVRPGFEVRDFGYDTNIFVSTTNEIGDLTITLVPKLDGLILFGDRAFLTFEERLEYTAYRDYSDQNFHNQRFTTRATFPLQSTGFFVDGTYNRLKERPADAQDIRADRDEDRLGLGMIFQAGWRTEIELEHSKQRLRFSDEDADPAAPITIGQRLDRTEDRNSAEVRYHALGRTRLTLNAELGTIDFESILASGGDSKSWAIVPGVNFGEGGRVSGVFKLGWQKINAESPLQADFDELVGRAQLAYRPGSRTTFRLEGRREPGFSVSLTSVFFLNTRADVRAIYYLNRLFGFEAGGGRGKLEFPDSLGGFDRVDRINSYDAGLRFRMSENSIGRRVEYILRFKHWRTESNDPRQNRSRNVLGLNAVVGF